MIPVSRQTRGRDKWHFLKLGARWDHSTAPIYEAAARGKCVPLLKTLLTSHCKNECAYCALRSDRRCPRTTWPPEKLAKLTMHLWEEGKVQGLFLSSSVFKDPDYTMEKQLEVLRHLRKMGFSGYIHLRLMPGVGRHHIREAAELADRVGVNLEAPNKDIFDELCPDKGGFKEAVLKRLEWIGEEVQRIKSEKTKRQFGFARAGIDTQMVVGAVDDNDWEYLKVTEWLYKRHGLKRVYYSGFEPVPHTPLERRVACSPSREYRLYQCSFLIRDYGFKSDLFAGIVDDEGFLSNVDPKLALARMSPNIFPIDLNDASHHIVMRIPGVGPATAKKIIEARGRAGIRYTADLERILGANMARRISRYVELKDKRLTDFSKSK